MRFFGFVKTNIEKMEKEKDIEGLKSLLKNKSLDIQKQSIYALSKILGSADDELRKKAADALSQAKGSLGVELLIGDLQSKDKIMSWRVITGLGKIGDSRAVSPLVAFIENKRNSSDTRAWALLSLCEIGDEVIVGPVLRYLRETNGDEQNVFHWKEVAVALGKIGEKAVDPLIECLKFSGGFYDTEEEVTEALTKIGSPAIESLTYASQNREGRIREKASEILKQLSGNRS